MERVTTQQLAMMPIEFKLNGKTVIGRPDETIIETREEERRRDPAPLLQAAACARTATAAPAWSRSRASARSRLRAAAIPKEGMEVTTDNPRAVLSQKMVLELLLSDMPETQYTQDNEVDQSGRRS